MTPQEKSIQMKGCTIGLIKKINREDFILKSGYETFEELSEYVQSNYPEFNQDEIEKCVSYAMQTAIKNNGE
jgi:hypothetical protein